MLFFIRHDFLDGLLKGGDAGHSHLLQLLLEAHREYQNLVASGAIVYDVYVTDFLGKHRYCEATSVPERNEYRRAYDLVRLLLGERKQLIREPFAMETLTEDDVKVLLEHFVNGDRSIGQHKRPSTRAYSLPELICKFPRDRMWLLADCANDAHFFTDKVELDDMLNLIQGKLPSPLRPDNLEGFAYFFDKLCEKGFIRGRWQMFFSIHGSILVKTKESTCRTTNFSSALSTAKRRGILYKERIDALLRHLMAEISL